MELFVFEAIAGGGTWVYPQRGGPSGSLLAEGLAMLQDVVFDLSALPDVSVSTLLDSRIRGRFDCRHATAREVNSAEQTLAEFRRLSSTCDACLIIAPEIDGQLAHWAQTAVDAGARLIGPDVEFIRWASDKTATCRHLLTHGIPAPKGMLWSPGTPTPTTGQFPVIVKPVFGAGCLGVKKIPSAERLEAHLSTVNEPHRIETFIPGQPASVSLICFDNERLEVLPPCTQQLSDSLDTYLGGALIEDGPLAERARALATAALTVAPAARGYIGVDLVLAEQGRGPDHVIEINPRLTSSYHCLRRFRVAQSMIDVVQPIRRTSAL